MITSGHPRGFDMRFRRNAPFGTIHLAAATSTIPQDFGKGYLWWGVASLHTPSFWRSGSTVGRDSDPRVAQILDIVASETQVLRDALSTDAKTDDLALRSST